METEETFFDFAAEVGLTKHFGGNEATRRLAELCHIGPDADVLDVGCGAGTTPALLAKTYGCRVVGVDIRDRMIERARETAGRARVSERVEFRTADAQHLPFADNRFDAVITESVTAFPEDKQQAVSEYVRVTKPGGYVGLSEATWLKTPPPPDLVAWVAQDIGATVTPLTSSEWKALLEQAGLKDIVVTTFEVRPAEEARGLLARYGLRGMLRVVRRQRRLYARNAAYRAFIKKVRQTGAIPEHWGEYFGYGMYVGRK